MECYLHLIVLSLGLPMFTSSEVNRPHIIFILADDLGFADVGYRNGSVVKTPNIDKLASEGVKLERHYGMLSCMPSRSSLMMGRYQIHTGFDYRCLDQQMIRLCMAAETVTLPMKLKEYGYSTHMIGKWHLGHEKKKCVPTSKGFDSFFGYHAAGGDYYTHRLGGGRPDCRDLWRNFENVADKYANQYSTHIFTKEAQQIVEEHDPKQPMFMYLAYQAVHGPLEVPNEYFDLYKNEDVDDIRKIYAAMATCMDEGIGNLTSTLKETGLWNNTVLIFASDNGAQFHTGGRNWPLRGGKGTIWEGGVRVLSFVNSPLLVKPRRSSYEMMHMIDWLPTLVHLAGGTVDGVTLDGISMWDMISGGSPSPRKELLIHMSGRRQAVQVEGLDPWEHNGIYEIRKTSAIVVGHWKLVTSQYRSPLTWVLPPEYHQGDSIPPPEKKGQMLFLFNLEQDPNEETDLSNSRPDIVVFLLKKLQTYYEEEIYCESGSPYPSCKRLGDKWGPIDL
ncbi:arylsulfatase B-like [Glandiceps talaboti]